MCPKLSICLFSLSEIQPRTHPRPSRTNSHRPKDRNIVSSSLCCNLHLSPIYPTHRLPCMTRLQFRPSRPPSHHLLFRVSSTSSSLFPTASNNITMLPLPLHNLISIRHTRRPCMILFRWLILLRKRISWLPQRTVPVYGLPVFLMGLCPDPTVALTTGDKALTSRLSGCRTSLSVTAKSCHSLVRLTPGVKAGALLQVEVLGRTAIRLHAPFLARVSAETASSANSLILTLKVMIVSDLSI